MSGFTKISSRRCGLPRFPSKSADEPVNSPVTTYCLTPEEVAAKYGPPTPPGKTRRQKLSQENLTELLRTKTVGQVAERFGVPQKLVFELCDRFGLELDDKNRLQEDKIMAFEKYDPKKASDGPKAVKRLTVAHALELREKTIQEVKCFELVEKALEDIELTPGINAVLVGYRDGCAETLDRLNKALETVEITI